MIVNLILDRNAVTRKHLATQSKVSLLGLNDDVLLVDVLCVYFSESRHLDLECFDILFFTLSMCSEMCEHKRRWLLYWNQHTVVLDD